MKAPAMRTDTDALEGSTPTPEAEPTATPDAGVMQADRDAAASISVLSDHADMLRNGEYDDHPTVQAFARHRQQSASPSGLGWTPISEYPTDKQGRPVEAVADDRFLLVIAPELLDEDFNPTGLGQAHYQDDGTIEEFIEPGAWVAPKWCNSHGEFHLRVVNPTHFAFVSPALSAAPATAGEGEIERLVHSSMDRDFEFRGPLPTPSASGEAIERLSSENLQPGTLVHKLIRYAEINEDAETRKLGRKATNSWAVGFREAANEILRPSPPATRDAEKEALREALRRFIYETTHLSPMEEDGSHWCSISADCLKKGREAFGGRAEVVIGDDAVAYLTDWAKDIERHGGHSVDALKLRSIAGEIATLRIKIDLSRKAALAEAENAARKRAQEWGSGWRIAQDEGASGRSHDRLAGLSDGAGVVAKDIALLAKQPGEVG